MFMRRCACVRLCCEGLKHADIIAKDPSRCRDAFAIGQTDALTLETMNVFFARILTICI
jgi:hypothetical protein